jgi:structural maintenance of chromosome 3 (chondroitin sulfate proteoglycan 6)
VAHLDRVKDEQIERTFKQVSREFANIFERLVPAGHGRLVIQRRADRRQDPEDSDEEPRGGVENYTGVGISVSFNSKTLDEQQKIQQLSGGQKSMSPVLPLLHNGRCLTLHRSMRPLPHLRHPGRRG